MEESDNLKELRHHKQQELCTTRPAYRQGRNLTAVKAYTIANESQHLFIYGVPQIKLRAELKNLCSKYGQIQMLHIVTDHKTETFTECYHVHYTKIQSARIAKRKLDNRSFYGGILHVCYAPERESLEDTKAKLLQRSKDVLSRLYGTLEKSYDDCYHLKRKRDEHDLKEPKEKIGKVSEESAQIVFGPKLPDNYQKDKCGDAFIPLQPAISVQEKTVCNVEKKIVFRNA